MRLNFLSPPSIVIGVVAAAALWAFVGVERIVSDHEIGVAWEPFIKHRPSLQVWFENPAQKGLELTPVVAMPASEHAAFIGFCELRFGEVDAVRCFARVAGRSV
jgi:hypothetical protein